MKQLLKKVIRRMPPPLRNLLTSVWQRRQLSQWEKLGRPLPPPHIVKQQTIRSIAKQYGLQILVETGTHHGDMVEAMKPFFRQIYSIELSDELYAKAKKRFLRDNPVTIIHGDSGIELGKLVPTLDQPALFWLDGHYSGEKTARGERDTPVYAELLHIFNAHDARHVIVIDDARCFGQDPAYPSIEALRDFITLKNPDTNIEVAGDSIRITPAKQRP